MGRLYNKKDNVKFESLGDRCEKDKVWDSERKECDLVCGLYFEWGEFERYFEGMEDWWGGLEFNEVVDKERGEINIKVRKRDFWGVGDCGVCEWRKWVMWKGKFYKGVGEMEGEYKWGRWLFVSVRVEKCEMRELKKSVSEMNKGFKKMIKRKDFLKYKVGFVKRSEMRKGRRRKEWNKGDGDLDMVLMMKSRYFKDGYLKSCDWGEMWRDWLGVWYRGMSDVRKVKGKKGGGCRSWGVGDGVGESLKYGVKGWDMRRDGEWLEEVRREVFKLGFVCSGGVLKDLFKEEGWEEDLLLLSEEEEEDEDLGWLSFKWYKKKRKYRGKIVE